MNRKEILEKVTAINEELLQKGYSFKGIETFWNECFQEAAKKMIDSKENTERLCKNCNSIQKETIIICKNCYLESVEN